MFLTPADLIRLTGRRQRAGQKKVLAAKGYAFDEDGMGWPLVLVGAVERRLLGAPQPAERTGPDPAALAALMDRR